MSKIQEQYPYIKQLMARLDGLYNECNSKEEPLNNSKKASRYYLLHWKWFVFSLLCFLVIGSIYLFTATPQYEIQAIIFIKDHKKAASSSASMMKDSISPHKRAVENDLKILHSYALWEQVAQKLNLQVSYSQKNALKTVLLYSGVPVKVEIVSAGEALYSYPLHIDFGKSGQLDINGKRYPKNGLAEGDFGVLHVNTNDSLLSLWRRQKNIIAHISPLSIEVESLRKHLRIQVLGQDSSALQLSILSPIPEKGKDIINHLITEYNMLDAADKEQPAGTLAFIDKRIDSLSKHLEAIEKNMRSYKPSQVITDTSYKTPLSLHVAQQNEMARGQADTVFSALKEIEHYVQQKNADYRMKPALQALNDTILLPLIAALDSAEAKLIKTLHTKSHEDSVLWAYEGQIPAWKRNSIDTIYALRDHFEMTLHKLETNSQRLVEMIQSVPIKECKAGDIAQQEEIQKQLEHFLLLKRKEMDALSAAIVRRPVDVARSSEFPVKPAKWMVIFICSLLGLLLPVIILWIRSIFCNRITTKKDITNTLNVPIAGEIALLQQATKIVAISKTQHIHTEQIHAMCTKLDHMSAANKLQILLVTSSIDREGKSFLTTNLGAGLASTDKRAVIIDFDLRKPNLHKTVGVNNDEGLSNYLAGQVTLNDITHPVPQVENLDIITGGDIPANPHILLRSDMLAELMEELKKQYRYIIIDTPPLCSASDAKILSRFVNVSIYIIRQHYTLKKHVKLINKLYAGRQLQNLCVVVNGIDEKKWHGY